MVSGNHLVFVDDPTTTVRLTGVNVPGGEWTGTPAVEKIDRSVIWAIDNWNANFIRLAVSINGWTGNYSYVSDGGKSYRNFIDNVIQSASERGAYVILDLHHYKSFEKEDYITFWKEAAVKYANNPTVFFGILNEPHSTSWDVWRNGDGASVYGHQYVVEMIRDLGAKNIIVAGGLDWGYKLGGIVDGYALVDQGTNNNKSKTGYGIMYDTHIYPWKGHTSNWDSNVGAVRKLYPVVVGECGWDSGTIQEIGNKNPQPGDKLYHDKWVPELLAWFDDDTTYGAKINYTAYCMHPSSAPQLIVAPDANGNAWKSADYSYTPTEYWGAYLVPHLQASASTRYGSIDAVVGLTTINIINPKVTYNVGDAFDKSTGYLDVTYADGTTAKVNLSDSGVTITGFNSNSAAESQVITVGYSGKTVTFTIVINDPNANVAAKSYLDLDFEDAAYAKNSDGTDNYAIIQTTNKATGNKIDVNFYNSSSSNRYQVYTADGSTYVATKGRKTNSAFDFRPEQSVADKSNKVYVELKVKRVSYSNDDPVSIVFTDDNANPIFRLNYKQNVAPVLVANSTYETVTYPNNGDWTYLRAIIDFSTSTFELYQGSSLSSLTGMVSGTTTFGFESASAVNISRITNYGIGNRKGSLAFDDIKIYTVGEGGSDTPAVTLSSIAVSGAQTAYNVGDVFVAPTVTASYSDGSTKTVTGAAFSGYNMAVAGSQTVTVSYGGKTTTYTINVAPPEKVVESISVTDAKTQYTWGDEFVPPTVVAKYTNSYYADEVVTGANFLNYNMKEVRTQSVRVVYGGKATTYSITVSAPPMVVSSIQVTGAKTAYIIGEDFVVPNVIVKYTSEYYSSQIMTPTCTGYNMSQLGTQTVTASYAGLKTTYQITISEPDVVPPTLESITVSGQRTGYNVGDAFIAPTVIASYSDGSTKTVQGAAFSGYNMAVPGTQTVTVTYENKTTTYQITVTAVQADYEFELTVGSADVQEGATTITVPVKITKMFDTETIGCLAVNVLYDTEKFTWTEAGGYTAGSMIPNPAADLIVAEPGEKGSILVSFTTDVNAITPAGVAADNTFVTLTFTINDNTTSFTSDITMTPAARLNDGEGETLIKKTALGDLLLPGVVTYTGAAPAPILTSISVSGAKTSYTVGDAFVAPTVTAKYSDGSTKTVTGAAFSGYNMSIASTQTVTVAYEGKTTTYQITVEKAPVVLSSITVSGQKTSYVEGDSFVKPSVTAIYSDGTSKDVTEEATFTGFDMDTPDTYTVTVSYGGKTTSYSIVVSASNIDFILKVEDVTIPVGATTVTVPVKITKMFDTEKIGCLAVNVIYDTEKFTWTEAGGYTAGSMIPVPAADLIVAEPYEAGSILASFTTDVNPITPAGVAADNTFITLTFGVKDSTAPFTSSISMTPSSKLNDENGETLISKKALVDALRSGTVTAEKSAPQYDAQVLTTRHLGYDEEDVDVYYVKSLVLTEGNGVYAVKVGDYELTWSAERQCYVGVTSAENYNVETKQFLNITISTTETAPALKMYGDITGDGRINNNDLVAIKNYIQFGTPLPVRLAADTNLDGNLNFTDLSKIRFYIESMVPIL